MAQEIELKLSIPAAFSAALRNHPILKACSVAAPIERRLDNTYFDTPDQALNRHAVALRIRHQGTRRIQTLKTRGNSQGGLHQRHEWEWDLNSDALDRALIPPGALPDSVDTQALRPTFRTDFTRTEWQLDYPFAGQRAHIELVLDQGWAISGVRKDAICEVELELKTGDPHALFDLALQLAQAVPLRICRISKAERGHRLQDPQRARDLPTLNAPVAHTPGSVALGATYQALLTRCQAALEAFEFLQEFVYLQHASEALQQLAALLERFSPLFPIDDPLRDNLQQRRQSLARCLAPWQRAQQRQRASPSTRDKTLQLHAARDWLNDRDTGLCLLQLGELGFRQPWLASTHPLATGPVGTPDLSPDLSPDLDASSDTKNDRR